MSFHIMRYIGGKVKTDLDETWKKKGKLDISIVDETDYVLKDICN